VLFIFESVSWADFVRTTKGWSIQTYKYKDQVPLSTNKLTSPRTQLTYEYASLPFVCLQNKDGVGAKFGSGRVIGLNLGEILRGDRVSISDYELQMGVDEELKYLGDREIDQAGIERARRLIKAGYIVEWLVFYCLFFYCV
jgi:transmembrane 9 superfamily protein 2/4